MIDMITEMITLMGNLNTAHDFFSKVSGIFNGSKDESAHYLDQITQTLKSIDACLKTNPYERLSDTIIYTPLLESVRDVTQTQQRIITDLRAVREFLEPVQRALGGEIVSSALIESPNKMQNALSRSPWEVLSDIRPAHLAARPNNPDFVPIFFKYQGMYYIGWFMRGALIPSFDCEFSKIWTPDSRIIVESEQVTESELKYLAEERLKMEQALKDIAKQRDEVSRQTQLSPESEKLRRSQDTRKRSIYFTISNSTDGDIVWEYIQKKFENRGKRRAGLGGELTELLAKIIFIENVGLSADLIRLEESMKNAARQQNNVFDQDQLAPELEKLRTLQDSNKRSIYFTISNSADGDIVGEYIRKKFGNRGKTRTGLSSELTRLLTKAIFIERTGFPINFMIK